MPKTFRHFLADETNTPFTVKMVLKVGGSDPVHGPVEGIHSHMNVSNKIEFISLDENRLKIPWVRVTDANGKVTEYRTEEFTEDISKHPIRTMDCMDCHNRPAHKFAVAERRRGPIDRHGPDRSLHPVGQGESRRGAWPSPTPPARKPSRRSTEFLRAEYPDDKRVDALIDEALAIYSAEFLPRDEGRLARPSGPHRPQGHQRLLPLP